MTDANLRERAKRVGDSIGHTRSFDGTCVHICHGCRAERAALEELRAAVAEEREAMLKSVQQIPYLSPDNLTWAARNYRSGWNQCLSKLERDARARGQR